MWTFQYTGSLRSFAARACSALDAESGPVSVVAAMIAIATSRTSSPTAAIRTAL